MNIASRMSLLAATALMALALPAAALTGSGKQVTEERKASGFTRISLSLPGRVDLTQGSAEGVTVTADDNVVPEIETLVENGTLKLRFRRNTSLAGKSTIRIAVQARNIDSISVAGSGDVHAPALTAPRLTVSIAGSGNVHIAGRTDALDANISGSGDLGASQLDTQSAKISVAGSGDAVVWARKALTVSVAGSGDIRYYGDPAVTKSVVGSGSVRRLGAAPS